jgi:hypothetical protein
MKSSTTLSLPSSQTGRIDLRIINNELTVFVASYNQKDAFYRLINIG